MTKKHRHLQEHELIILNELFSKDAEDEEIELLETVRSASDTSLEVEEKISLQDALSILTLQQQKVIIATFFEDFTELETAKKLGVSQQAVHKIKDRALKKLEKKLVLKEPTETRPGP